MNTEEQEDRKIIDLVELKMTTAITKLRADLREQVFFGFPIVIELKEPMKYYQSVLLLPGVTL